MTVTDATTTSTRTASPWPARSPPGRHPDGTPGVFRSGQAGATAIRTASAAITPLATSAVTSRPR